MLGFERIRMEWSQVGGGDVIGWCWERGIGWLGEEQKRQRKRPERKTNSR